MAFVVGIRCCIERDGFAAALKLSASDMAKFRLCDMTTEQMKKFARVWRKKEDAR